MSIIGRIAIVFGLIAGCAGCAEDTPPRTPISCGDQTCGPDQLCAVITAGHVCDGGDYAVLRQYCMDRPTTCGDTISCDCIAGCSLATGESRPCLQAEDRGVSCGCF